MPLLPLSPPSPGREGWRTLFALKTCLPLFVRVTRRFFFSPRRCKKRFFLFFFLFSPPPQFTGGSLVFGISSPFFAVKWLFPINSLLFIAGAPFPPYVISPGRFLLEGRPPFSFISAPVEFPRDSTKIVESLSVMINTPFPSSFRTKSTSS